MNNLDNIFHVRLKPGVKDMIIVVRIGRKHPFYKTVINGRENQRNYVWKEIGDYYYTSDKNVTISGRRFRELRLPFTPVSNSHIEKFRASVIEFLLMSWIKHKRNEKKEERSTS